MPQLQNKFTFKFKPVSETTICGRTLRIGAALATLSIGLGCAAMMPVQPPPQTPRNDLEVYHRAESARADQLSQEVARLQVDLRQAEEALIEVESGLRGKHTRANAVSTLAEARILAKRAAQLAPWRGLEIKEVNNKITEAERQVQQNNPGAALFFIYRARRIAEYGLLEAEFVDRQDNTFYVEARRANLRAGPSTDASVLRVLARRTPVFVERQTDNWVLVRVISGSAGWIHESLIRQ